MTEEVQVEQEAPIAGIGTMVFGKWDASEVTCDDPGLAPYINLTTIGTLIQAEDTPTPGSASPNFPLSNASSTI